MLTARGAEADRLQGFALGADDYLVKPFSPRELVARIRAVLRRARPAAPAVGAPPLIFANLTIDPVERRVEVLGQAVELTPTEFNLLAFLAGHPGQVFTRDHLLDRVWAHADGIEPGAVTVHVRRLREKVEPDPVAPRHLRTVWGVGYKFEP
jgi:DNA-binding response OmpR family regulator